MDQTIEQIQFAYPQIYYACHTRHQRRKSNAARLSTRDAEILVHLDRVEPLTLSALTKHLDLAASTLSEAITTLESLGYVRKTLDARDRRRVALVLTTAGVTAVRATSVLDAARIARVLRRLSPRERTHAAAGLALLARACRVAASAGASSASAR